jgi:hypothetical protein
VRRFKEGIIKSFHDGIKHEAETTFGIVKGDGAILKRDTNHCIVS